MNYARTANRLSKGEWRGFLLLEASAAIMIARELRREIKVRYERQVRGNSAVSAAASATSHGKGAGP